MTEERDEPPVVPEPKKPAPCLHCDIERVGAFEVVCYQCKHVADWRELMAGNKDAWKPL